MIDEESLAWDKQVGDGDVDADREKRSVQSEKGNRKEIEKKGLALYRKCRLITVRLCISVSAMYYEI